MLVTFPPRVCRTAALLLALGVAGVPLSGCASSSQADTGWGLNFNIRDWVTPYKPELVQGNFVSREQVQALQKGMPRQQVQAILGTPLMASAFHSRRWEYVFILEREHLERQFYKFTVHFDANDQFERVEGDQMPTEAEFAARVAKPRGNAAVPVLEATEAQLQAFATKSAPAGRPPVAVPAAGEAPEAYPPLEALPAR